jgi:superkiller protein 3
MLSSVNSYTNAQLLDEIERLEKELRWHPQDIDRRSQLALLYIETNKPLDAIEQFEQILAIDSSHVQTHCNLGTLLVLLGDLENAAICFAHATHFDPDLAIGWTEAGRVALLQDNAAHAEQCLQRAIDLEPDLPEAFYLMAEIRFTQGRTDDTQALCQRALQSDPQFADAHALLGTIALLSGDAAQAVQSYAQAITLDPHHLDARCGFGQAHVLAGNLDEAEQAFQDACAIDNTYPLVLFGMGQILAWRERWDEAVAYFERARAMVPEHREIRLGWVHCMLELQKREEAAAECKLWLSSHPDDLQAIFLLARIFEEQGNFAEAIEQYRYVTDLAPEHALAHLSLGRIALQNGRKTEARAHLERAAAGEYAISQLAHKWLEDVV